MTTMRTLLRRATVALEDAKVPYAVAGGIAVNVHGYVRETKDVDIFLNGEDRNRALRAMREAGFVISDVLSPYLYQAFPGERVVDPLVRVDLMFPLGDPEISALETAEGATHWGTAFRVVSAEWLAITKFSSDRLKDQQDLAKLYELGSFDPDEARRLLSLMERGRVRTWDILMRRFKKGRTP